MTAITPEDLITFRATLRSRRERSAADLAALRQRALLAARQAAEFLKREFGVTRVMLFGSLAHARWYSDRSDIDLAAWGLGPVEHLEAMARLEDLNVGFRIDLLRAEHCTAGLREVIEKEGTPL